MHGKNRVLITVIVSAFLVLALFYVSRIYVIQERTVDAQVAGRERGNAIREYLAFDNSETILVLRAGLRPPQAALPRERRAREESLAKRIEIQKFLVPFDCESLK